MFSLKKIASVVMATAMAVTTAVPGTAITANAETTTMKALVNSSKNKTTLVNSKNVNKLSLSKSDDFDYECSSSLSKSGAAATWANKEMKGDTEKKRLGTPIAGKLDASKINGTDKSYWIKYKNLTLDSGNKNKKYDLIIAVEGAHGEISGADGPYISFFTKSIGSIRYSGYKYVTITYTITDAGKNTLSEDWQGGMTLWDIDSYQAVEVRNKGRLTWAGFGKGSVLNFQIPDSRVPSDSQKEDIVYCPKGEDAPDGATGDVARKYALFLRTKLTSANNELKIRYYAGGASGAQTNSIFLSFGGQTEGNHVRIDPDIKKYVNSEYFLKTGSFHELLV